MDPVNSATDVADVGSENTYKELVIEAISTINDGNGVDIKVISEFIKERRHEVPGKFMKRLRVKLKKLVSQNILAMVENRYKIFDVAASEATEATEASEDMETTETTEATEATETTEATDPTQALSPEEDSTSTSWMPKEETAKVIAEADNKEYEAKEAVEAWNRANELLEQSAIMLELANEIVDQCARGEEVYML